MIPAFLADRENKKRRGELGHESRVGAELSFDEYITPGDFDEVDEDYPTLECKGSSVPAAPSPMAEAQAQIELERARAQFEQEKAARDAAAAAAEKQARIDKARPLQSQAYNAALDYGTQQVGARGYDQGLVDQYGLLNLYNTSVNNARMGIAEDDLTPMTNYNTNTMFNDALNTVLGKYRGDLTRQLNNIAPEDFGYSLFADTADDAILQSILDQGRADALAQIDSAKARGQLNDSGYSRALQQLNNQASAGMSDLQDLGQGVLSGYRKQLDAMRDDWLRRIGTVDFTSGLNFDMFNNRLNQTTSDLNSRLSGDLYRAAQGESFFDPSTIISSSGAVQGFYNPTGTTQKQSGGVTNPLLNAFTTDAQKKDNKAASPLLNGVF